MNPQEQIKQAIEKLNLVIQEMPNCTCSRCTEVRETISLLTSAMEGMEKEGHK